MRYIGGLIRKATKTASFVIDGCTGSNLADTLAQHHVVVVIDNLATGPAG